jgi:hypothetical protein
MAAEVTFGGRLCIKAQLALTLAGVRSVTGVATIGQDWPDVAVELNGCVWRCEGTAGSDGK